jgi:hypothetical protein
MSIRDPRLLDHDPFTGITEFYHYDDETGGFGIETTQDITHIIETNKALWNDAEKHTPYGDMCRVAHVPNVVMMELAKQGMVTPAGRILDDKAYRRWLNSPDAQYFRTRPGKV